MVWRIIAKIGGYCLFFWKRKSEVVNPLPEPEVPQQLLPYRKYERRIEGYGRKKKAMSGQSKV